jgi:plasmid stabilization system protein ParE
MAGYRVVLTQEAQENISETVAYIAQQSGSRPANTVLTRMTDGLRTLEQIPQRCAPSKKPWVAKQGGRDYIFLRLPYVAPFLIDENAGTVTVTVIAVYHTKMNWQT